MLRPQLLKKVAFQLLEKLQLLRLTHIRSHTRMHAQPLLQHSTRLLGDVARMHWHLPQNGERSSIATPVEMDVSSALQRLTALTHRLGLQFHT